MVLCHIRKLDQNNRLFIPKDYIRRMGGHDNCSVYVMLDEDTKEIKIKCKEDDEDALAEENNE